MRRMTLMAIDVGNTRLKWALYDAPEPGAQVLAQGVEFLENIEKLADGPWAGLPPPQRMLGCIVAGDAVKRRVEEQMELWDVAPQWVVSSAAEAGLTNGYDHPARLGCDRWVAMIGARQRLLAHGPARPLVVVMVGTAVTVDALDADGRFAWNRLDAYGKGREREREIPGRGPERQRRCHHRERHRRQEATEPAIAYVVRKRHRRIANICREQIGRAHV